MLRFSAERIIGFWGHAGLALLRSAIVNLPSLATNKKAGTIGQLKVLQDLVRLAERSIII